MTTSFLIFTCFTAVLSAPSVFQEKRYSVFLGDGPLTSLVAYAPPLPRSDLRTEPSEPRVIDNDQLPPMLCGALIVSENQLLTSIRCSPSVASKTIVYVFPADTRDYLSQLDEAKVLDKVVVDVSFKYKLTASGVIYSNVALVKLDDDYFSASINLLQNNQVSEVPSQTTSENLIAVANLEKYNQTSNEFEKENYDINDADYEVYYEYEESSEGPTNVPGAAHEKPEETFSAVQILDLTSTLIDVAAAAEEAQQSNLPAQTSDQQYKTTTPLCTLREEYEDAGARKKN